MTDTPQHIYNLQLKLWLEKTPGERLYRQLVDNDALYRFWNNAKPAADNSNKLINTKNALDGADANLNAVKK